MILTKLLANGVPSGFSQPRFRRFEVAGFAFWNVTDWSTTKHWRGYITFTNFLYLPHGNESDESVTVRDGAAMFRQRKDYRPPSESSAP